MEIPILGNLLHDMHCIDDELFFYLGKEIIYMQICTEIFGLLLEKEKDA